MMKRRWQWSLALWLIGSMLCTAVSCLAAPPEITEFPFNRTAAVLHGQAALEDFSALMMKEQQLANYDLTKPFLAATYSQDCSANKIKVVVIAFQERKGTGWAYSVWEQNRDGLISRMLSVGFSVETLDSIIERAKAGSALCE